MKRWTPEEVQLLRNNWGILKPQEIMMLFPDRTKKSVQRKVQELGLKRPRGQELLDRLPSLRKCTKCEIEKPLDRYSRDSRARDGMQSHCLDCVYEYTKLRRSRNPEVIKQEYARRKGARISKVKLEDVYRKTKGICYLCEKPIDLDRVYPDKLSLSLDHFYPLSLNGDHSFENLFVTHLICNMRKSNKVI